MAEKHLGPVFDIHGGGIDLVFPHHENEIAQSRCAHGTPVMANYWMHNGFLQVEGEKMSKSLGNFITIHDLLKDWPGEVVRFNMLRTHYRQPIDWTKKGLEELQATLDRWAEICDNAGGDCRWVLAAEHSKMIDALKDDLNTPLAIAKLHERVPRTPRAAPIANGQQWLASAAIPRHLKRAAAGSGPATTRASDAARGD